MLAAGEGDRVELVEEEHAGREVARLQERVVQVPLADAEVRVEDLLDADIGERQAAFARRRTRKQRLPAARRPEEQHPAADAALVLLVEVVPLEREDDGAVDRLLDLLEPADVREHYGRPGVEPQLRRALVVGVPDELHHLLETEAGVDLAL